MKELNSVLKSIKNKELLPIYFFHGEEPYFMDVAVKSFENDVLEEDEKAFNQTVVYGKDTSYTEVLSLARQFPMMGDRQVIILKEAQDIKLTEKESEALKNYAENPAESTLLIIAHKYKKVDARKAFAKILAKKGMLFESQKIRDNEVAKWIDAELKHLKISAKPNIPVMLAEYLGADLSRIANELAKLKQILKYGEILDDKLVEKHIGISKEFNVFELIKALGRKDAAASLRIAHFMGKSAKNNPLPATLSNLYNFFSNLIIYHTSRNDAPATVAQMMNINPYFLKDYDVAARSFGLKSCTRIISLLRETDLKNKGLGAVNVEEAELLREIIFKIINIEKLSIKL